LWFFPQEELPIINPTLVIRYHLKEVQEQRHNDHAVPGASPFKTHHYPYSRLPRLI